MNSALLEKLKRRMDAASAKLSDVLTREHEDPIWANEQFWQRRWPALCDSYSESVEAYSAQRLKEFSQ